MIRQTSSPSGWVGHGELDGPHHLCLFLRHVLPGPGGAQEYLTARGLDRWGEEKAQVGTVRQGADNGQPHARADPPDNAAPVAAA